MDIPQNVQIYEHTVATFYFDEDGILHLVSKPAPRTIDLMADYFECIKKITNNKKVYALTDVSNATPLDKKTRDFSNEAIKEIYLAMAMVSGSPVGKMIGNLFFALNTPSLPIKMFSNEKDAIMWLKSMNSLNR